MSCIEPFHVFCKPVQALINEIRRDFPFRTTRPGVSNEQERSALQTLPSSCLVQESRWTLTWPPQVGTIVEALLLQVAVNVASVTDLKALKQNCDFSLGFQGKKKKTVRWLSVSAVHPTLFVARCLPWKGVSLPAKEPWHPLNGKGSSCWGTSGPESQAGQILSGLQLCRARCQWLWARPREDTGSHLVETLLVSST